MEGAPSKQDLKECSSTIGLADGQDKALGRKEENSVRLLVQEEGRAARNLIAFSVPCDMVQVDSSKVSRKPPSSPRTVQELKKEDGPTRSTKRTPETSTSGPRVRSASTGRDKKSELQARYWAFLFDNLQRAVDEIYQTCETDESVSECKEVILVLENFTKDFHNLIEWFRLKWEYEQTPPPQRPNSLAWEVRKSSPGKIHSNVLPTFSSPVRRILNFGDPNEKERSRPNAEKIPDSLKTGKCSPIIPPVVEDQEVVSFKSVTVSSNGQHEADEGSSCMENDVKNECALNAMSEEKEELPQERDLEIDPCSEPFLRNLTNQMNTESEKLRPDCKVVNDVLVNNVGAERCRSTEILLSGDPAPEFLLPGMSSQACQTDPELEDTAMDLCSNPTMVDKGVGTTPKIAITSRSQSTRTSSLIVAGSSRSTLSVIPPSTFAGAATRSPVTNARSTSSAFMKSATLPSKNLPLLANSNAKISTSNGPNGISSLTSAATVKTIAASGSCTVKASSSMAVTSSTISVSIASKTPSAATINRPSTASVVKRSAARPISHLSSVINNHVSGRPPGPPKLLRSRTVSEVSRSNRPGHNNRPGTAKQVNQNTWQQGQSVVPSALRVDPSPSKAKPSIVQNVSGQEGNKKNESSDDSGWETVKNRSRWRLSCNYNPKQRFNKLTCAVSLPALIILDDDRDACAVNKNPLCKQNSQDASSHRRHSERMEPSQAEIDKLKKSQKSQPSDLSTVNGKKVEKVGSIWPKQSIGRKAGREMKGNGSSASVKTKTQENCSMKSKKGGQSLCVDKGHGEVERKQIMESKENNDPEQASSILWKSFNGSKLADLNIDPTLSGDESSIGPGTSSTTTPTTMTPTTTPATPTTPTNSASDSLTFLRDGDCVIDRLISDDEDLIAERTLLKEEERKSQQLYEEEAKLQQQIDELQSSELEVEIEIDGETQIGTEEEEEEELLGSDEPRDTDVEVDTMSLEARYENMLEGLSWAERMDTLEQLEALVARHPGRALQLHQKLSSPSRSRATTLPETLRRFQARQEKAQQKRERLLQLKSQKLRDLLNKVGEVKAAQAQLTEDRRLRLENKLKRAEENRNLHLRSIKRKAHDEEEKLKEIAFINELEAQNKRHDLLALRQEQEERLQGIAEERQRKQEEKAAKEAAVEERKRALEAERLHKLEEMQARRKRRVERIHREQLEKEKERQEAAREKARDREERLSALHAAQLATQEELQKKIQQKQEDSARRHEENIEHIRQRALDSAALRYADDAAPALEPYHSKKLCTLCNVLIGSEVYLLSHLRGKSHQEALRKSSGGRSSATGVNPKEDLVHITEAPPDCVDEKQERHRERQRALRKRSKKLRLRMTARGQEYEKSLGESSKVSSPNSARIQKCLRDIEKLYNNQGLGQWSDNAVTLLERALAEINRILCKMVESNQSAFCSLNGFSTICNILSLGLNVPEGMAPYLPSKCFVTACTTLSIACRNHAANAEHVLLSNRISTVLDLLMCRLKEVVPDEEETTLTLNGSSLPSDSVAVALMRLLALLLGFAEDGATAVRARDVVSYTVCSGAVDRLALVCSGVRDPLPDPPDGDPQAPAFLLSALELLSALTARCGGVGRPDPSGLGATLRSTELVGAVSMLYGLLLQQGGAPRDPDASPPSSPALGAPTAIIARATIGLLVGVAELDLEMFQSILGAEGISLQLRHISAHLLWVCVDHLQVREQLRDLLHEVIRVLGYFAVLNHDNQLVLQSGVQPTVLQQLCQLPFPYFSEPRLSAVLFPTLLACCRDNAENRAILEQELSYKLLEVFRASSAAEGDRLMALLRDAKADMRAGGQGRSKTASRASSVCSNGDAAKTTATLVTASTPVVGPNAKKARRTTTTLDEDGGDGGGVQQEAEGYTGLAPREEDDVPSEHGNPPGGRESREPPSKRKASTPADVAGAEVPAEVVTDSMASTQGTPGKKTPRKKPCRKSAQD